MTSSDTPSNEEPGKEPSILDAVTPDRHRIEADDEPTAQPHPEAGDSLSADDEQVVSHDERPDLELPASDDTSSPAERLFESTPASTIDVDTAEELSALD